ncbi:signal transduction histidine kinase [Kribbella orskensis]|uniref:histidine kinase n=1 Tax=Kribbella orskensis TaxID=2512216 RepID=A0ABY2B666_9ACTN|nr:MULTISPECIES: sensor histidine kinase [Kribbella]TCN28594.1 signal transduction histidine kinase [Kribbella sp. VKM Ac-2500]TCO08542.1 signal transduction histidine kinase [Kribbella orskensis]
MQDIAGVTRAGSRGRPGRIHPLGDWLLVAAVALLHVLNPRIGPGGPEQGTSILLGAVWLGLVLVQSVPLLWRRRRPAVVLVAVSAAWVVAQVVFGPSAPFGLWVAVYSAIVHATRRTAEVGAAAATAVVAALELAQVGRDRLRLEDALPMVVVTLVVVIVGFVVADRRTRSAALRDRAEFLEREREALSLQAAAEERLRIARELHDLVAHSLTTIAIQSSTGRLALPQHPDMAQRALAAIETTSRDASREMRQLLGVLRQGGDTPAQLDPPPGLANLDDLVGTMRHAGADLRLAVEGDRRPLSRSLDLVAYRVVQEALTNVVKHAGHPAAAAVLVRYDGDQLVLEITDDGAGKATSSDGHPGLGIVGMRERVTALGGQFTAGPRPVRGFRVEARLPIRAGDEA